jgi:hypothetical protein
MHPEILTPTQVRVLDRLKGVSSLPTFYMAGGTALALRHGHRRSVDFDFFRDAELDGEALLRELRAALGEVEQIPTDPSALYVVIEGVTTSFFPYRYPLLAPGQPTQWQFDLASDDDIAAMKLEAVAGRGSRKDFVDLRILCASGYPLDLVFDLFDRKFGSRQTSRYHRIRALSYFADAEAEPMPEMLVEFEWPECVRFFTAEVTRLLDTLGD